MKEGSKGLFCDSGTHNREFTFSALDFAQQCDKTDIELLPTSSYTVEPQLSEPTVRHTIWSDKWGIRIDEMESRLAENWGSVGDNRKILGLCRKMGMRHHITV